MYEKKIKNTQKFACNHFKNSLASGDFVPSPLTGLYPWTPLGDSRPPDPLWLYPNPKPSSAAFGKDPASAIPKCHIWEFGVAWSDLWKIGR